MTNVRTHKGAEKRERVVGVVAKEKICHVTQGADQLYLDGSDGSDKYLKMKGK